jgi:hypothetical protein
LFPLPADHRCLKTPRRARLGADGDERIRRDWLRLPLQVKQPRIVHFDSVPRQPTRRLPDQDLPRLGRLFQPGCDVHRVARGEPLLGAGDDLPGRDADSTFDRELFEGVAHLSGRPAGT